MKQETKWKIRGLWRQIKPNRKYKDRLFRRVFSEKKDLLELYNAVNGTHYTNPNDLEITTLEDSVYLAMKNDLSFIISSSLNLYEHQSTYNPNMPIRGLFYLSRLFEAYVEKIGANIYGSTLIKLPTPQFIVFYNGRDILPDESECKLSDAFEVQQSDMIPALECRARVLNINYGHNEALMRTCKRLHDYSYFVAEVNKNLDKGYSLNAAIDTAITKCMQEDVLTDILLKCESEVRSMLLTEFSMRKYRKMIKKEAKAEGLEEGRAEGRAEGRTEGEDRISELNVRLIESGRADEVLKAAKNKDYRKKLLDEFGL